MHAVHAFPTTPLFAMDTGVVGFTVFASPGGIYKACYNFLEALASTLINK